MGIQIISSHSENFDMIIRKQVPKVVFFWFKTEHADGFYDWNRKRRPYLEKHTKKRQGFQLFFLIYIEHFWEKGANTLWNTFRFNFLKP